MDSIVIHSSSFKIAEVINWQLSDPNDTLSTVMVDETWAEFLATDEIPQALRDATWDDLIDSDTVIEVIGGYTTGTFNVSIVISWDDYRRHLN